MGGAIQLQKDAIALGYSGVPWQLINNRLSDTDIELAQPILWSIRLNCCLLASINLATETTKLFG